MDPNLTLTEADLDALADRVVKKMQTKFYTDLGRGLWGLIWKMALGAVLTIAGWEWVMRGGR